MNGWSPDNAHDVLAAYGVVRMASVGDDLAEFVYRHWYAAPSPERSRLGRWAAPLVGSARAAHDGSSRWSGEVVDVVATGLAGVVVVGAVGGRRALCRGEYVTVEGRPGFAPRVGDRVRVLDRLGGVAHDGWWRTWGSAWNPREAPLDVVRVYLRPVPGDIARLVHAVTTALADVDQWMLKVAAMDEGLSRPDAAVVYLAGPHRMPLRDTVVRATRGLVSGSPPPLTAALGDGVGWAEDPGSGASFGEVRCEVLAAAYADLVAQHRADVTDGEWLDAVAAELVRRGLDPAAPHRAARDLAVAG